MIHPSITPALAQLGRIIQIAFIPADFDREIAFWTRSMGVGPFFHLAHIPLQNTRYRGNPGSADLSAALGYWGDVQIELVVQHDDTPSIYRDWRASGRCGVHHIGVIVDDFDAASALLHDRGGVAVQETEIVDATRAAYFEMPDPDCPLIELLWLQPHFMRLFDHMRAEAGAWDGITAPLRPPPESW